MPRVYELPTHLQVEDMLIAGLTARQLVRLMVGASLAYGLWDQAAWLAHDVAAGVRRCLACTGVLFALVQPGGRPLDQWLLAGVLFCALPRRLVWRPRPRSSRGTPLATSQAGPSLRRDRAGVDSDSCRAGSISTPDAVHAHRIPFRWRRGHDRRGAGSAWTWSPWRAAWPASARGPPTHAVTVLDVVGAEAALASADDATQEELLAGRAQFLNAQTTPFQVLVRAEPVDLEGHLRRVQARAERLPEALRAVALRLPRLCARHWPTSAPCSSATATWSCPTSAPRSRRCLCRRRLAASRWPLGPRCRAPSTIPRRSRARSRVGCRRGPTWSRASSDAPGCARGVSTAGRWPSCCTAAGHPNWRACSGCATSSAPTRRLVVGSSRPARADARGRRIGDRAPSQRPRPTPKRSGCSRWARAPWPI